MAGNLSTPLTVGNKFYSEDDFQYETDLMMEYLEGDLNQTIVLYAVDRIKTNLNTVYKETRNNGEGSSHRLRFRACSRLRKPT